MESLYPILGYAGRAALGLGLSVAFGVGCILGGRGLYLFSGSYGWTVWLWVMLVAAGTGAALGGYLAWLTAGAPRPDRLSSDAGGHRPGGCGRSVGGLSVGKHPGGSVLR